MNTGYQTTPGAANPPTAHQLFDEFETYPFSDDPDFKVSPPASLPCISLTEAILLAQAGLPTVIAAIRGTKRSASQIDEMIGRAQWFYFTRYISPSTPLTAAFGCY